MTRRLASTEWVRTTRAPSQTAIAVAAMVGSKRSVTGRSKISPRKSLLLIATSTGHPVSTSSGSRRVASSECLLFLPKS